MGVVPVGLKNRTGLLERLKLYSPELSLKLGARWDDLEDNDAQRFGGCDTPGVTFVYEISKAIAGLGEQYGRPTEYTTKSS